MTSRQQLPTSRQPYWYLAFILPLVCGPAWATAADVVSGPHLLGSVCGFVLIALLLVCSYTDTRWKLIPNWATYPAILWVLSLNLVLFVATGEVDVRTEPQQAVSVWAQSLGALGIVPALQGAIVCFGAMLLIRSLAGTGGGDVKLACVLGSLLGVEGGLRVIVWCHVLAGVTVLGWMIYQLGPWKLFTAVFRRIGFRLFPYWVAAPGAVTWRVLNKSVPLALFFAAGVALTLCGVTLR